MRLKKATNPDIKSAVEVNKTHTLSLNSSIIICKALVFIRKDPELCS